MHITSEDLRWLKNREHNIKVREQTNPEGQIQLAILKYLRGIGAKAGKTKTMGVRRGKSFCFDPYLFIGFPDVTCFHKNKLFFIEVKAINGKQSDNQKSFQTLCEQAGISYILARQLDDVSNIIN